MKLGYQLFSLLPLCGTREGLIDTIKKIAAIGYDGVEFFCYNGITAEEMKSLLEECAIEGCNSHVQLERWENDAEGEIIYAKEAGIPYVTIPWMMPELRNTNGYKKIKAMIPELVKLCKKHGVGLMYHNHEFEFKGDEVESGYVLDAILDSDPDVTLELDTFWTHYAGIDPAAYMEEKKDKLSMIHIKDYLSFTGGGEAGGQEMPSFCSIGSGKMNNVPILEWAEKNELPWVVVEQDNSSIDRMESAALSIKMLKELLEM